MHSLTRQFACHRRGPGRLATAAMAGHRTVLSAPVTAHVHSVKRGLRGQHGTKACANVQLWPSGTNPSHMAREWIGRHGEFRYLSIQASEVDVRRYGEAAALMASHQLTRARSPTESS